MHLRWYHDHRVHHVLGTRPDHPQDLQAHLRQDHQNHRGLARGHRPEHLHHLGDLAAQPHPDHRVHQADRVHPDHRAHRAHRAHLVAPDVGACHRELVGVRQARRAHGPYRRCR